MNIAITPAPAQEDSQNEVTLNIFDNQLQDPQKAKVQFVKKIKIVFQPLMFFVR